MYTVGFNSLRPHQKSVIFSCKCEIMKKFEDFETRRYIMYNEEENTILHYF